MPGRLYEIKVSSKVKYLREERDRGVPRSFSKLEMFLKERRLELQDFLDDTTEVAASPGDAMETEDIETEVDGDGDGDGDLEEGPEDHLDDSADEDYSDDGEEDE